MMKFSFLIAALVAQCASALQSPLTRPQQTASVLEDWQLLENGCVVGKIKGNPRYTDGDVITTSPLANPAGATEASFVTSTTGSSYLLGTPRFGSPGGYGGTQAAVTRNNVDMPREDFVGNFLQVFGLTSLVAGGTVLGYTVGGNGEATKDAVLASTPMGGMSMTAQETPSQGAWTKTTPGLIEPSGDSLSAAQVRDLFPLWNNALMTGNPDTVAMRYAKEAVLLPTKSDIPRSDYEGIRDYFVHFLEKRPTGKILESYVTSEPNYAMDVGIYEFAFQDGAKVRARYSFLYTQEDGEWKIKHHHSSGMPEAKGQVITKDEVRGLFNLWNDALLTGDSDAVAKRYAKGAVLLPTVSDIPRTTYDGIKDYFDHFLELKPEGKIIEGYVSIGENWCKDVGIYEFKKGTDGTSVRARYSYVYVFEDGEWKISHHHSSLMPEELLAKAKKA